LKTVLASTWHTSELINGLVGCQTELIGHCAVELIGHCAVEFG